MDEALAKTLANHQYERCLNELLQSGYVTKESEIDESLVKKYVNFKRIFPRTVFSKAQFDEVDKVFAQIKPDVDGKFYSAELIFNSLNAIDKIQDSVIYYWFSKIGLKFSASSVYEADAFKLVLFQALRRKNKLSEKGRMESWLR